MVSTYWDEVGETPAEPPNFADRPAFDLYLLGDTKNNTVEIDLVRGEFVLRLCLRCI